MTARKALDRLVAAGVLFRQPGKGTFVAPAKIAHRASTQRSFSAVIAALGLRLDTRVLEAAVVPAPASAAAALAEPKAAPVVFIRRLRIVEGQPAALHSAYLPVRFERLLRENLTGSLTELTAGIVAPLVQSQDAIEAIVAGPQVAQLLDVSAGSPLIRHEGVGFSAASEPLRYTEGLYRGDRFRFSIDGAGPTDLRPELTTAGADGFEPRRTLTGPR